MSIKEIVQELGRHTKIFIKQFTKAAMYIAVLGAIIMIAYQCASDGVNEGEVIDKQFLKAKSGVAYETKSTIKKSGPRTHRVPKYVDFPDRYAVTYANKEDTVTVFLRKEVFDTIQIGNWFEFNDNKGTKYEPYTPKNN